MKMKTRCTKNLGAQAEWLCSFAVARRAQLLRRFTSRALQSRQSALRAAHWPPAYYPPEGS